MAGKRKGRWEIESEDAAGEMLRQNPAIVESALSQLRGKGSVRTLVGRRDIAPYKLFAFRDVYDRKPVSVLLEIRRSRIVSGKVVKKKVPIFYITVELGHYPEHSASWENRVGKLRIGKGEDEKVDPKQAIEIEQKIRRLLPLVFSKMEYAHLPEHHQTDLDYAGNRLEKWLQRST